MGRVFTEAMMAPDARCLLPDAGVERGVGTRNAEKVLTRFKMYRLGTELLEVDLKLMRAERGPREPTERELRELRASMPPPSNEALGHLVGWPVLTVR